MRGLRGFGVLELLGRRVVELHIFFVCLCVFFFCVLYTLFCGRGGGGGGGCFRV